MSTDTNANNRYSVPGLERGLALLAEFTRAAPEWSAPDLAVRLGVPRSTVFRLLQTLESLGFLVRLEDGRKFRLGVSVLRLGFEYLASQSVVELGQPVVEALSLEVDLPAHLVVLDHDAVVYVVCSRPRDAFVRQVSVGTRLPAHATVFGRLLLGDTAPEALARLFPQADLPRSTSQTPGTLAELQALVEQDRKRGFGVSEGFYEPRISTVATPIRDSGGHIVAAVGLTVTGPSIDASLVRRGVVEKTVQAAARVSAALGYAGHVYVETQANALQWRSDREDEVVDAV